MAAAAREERWFRLRGEVDGVLRTFLLAPGENRLGSLPTNHVVLEVAGVSRSHAVLTPGPDGVRFRDLGSKNGIRFRGRRVAQGVLESGDRVRFGPLALEVEELAPGDAHLAIVLPPASAPPAVERPATPTVALGTRGVADDGRWLAVVDEMVELLRRPPRPDLPASLGRLAREVGAAGACLVRERGDGEPVVLAAWGRFGSAGGVGDCGLGAPSGPAAPGEAGLFGAPGSDPVGAWVAEGGGRLVLALWGAEKQAEAAPPLLTVLRLLAAFVGEPAPPPAAAGPGAARGLDFPPGYLLCRSPAMVALHREMRSIADSDLPVLLHGETGVGKELLARTLHLSSRRADGRFVAINCAAIPADLLEAEMFGIGKGVATGVEAREGRFRLADGGTLMLDEVGEMPPPLQAKLLRALESKEIQPVGRSPVPVDVRLVAASNADLKRLAADGRFREDLYYRLAGCVLEVPPLRERPEDVPLLVEHFVRRMARDAGRGVAGVTWNAMERLTAYPWPGNVRELQHEVQRLVYRCPEGGAIDSTLLSAEVVAGGEAGARAAGAGSSLRLDDHVEPLERRLIRTALERTAGNRTRAAALLGLSRNGLAYKMKSLDLKL